MYDKWPDFHEKEVGFPEQRALFDLLTDIHGAPPPVIDSDDLLEDPHRITRLWCEAVGIPFIESALSWSPGARDEVSWWDGGSFHANLRDSDGLKPQRTPVCGAGRHAGPGARGACADEAALRSPLCPSAQLGVRITVCKAVATGPSSSERRASASPIPLGRQWDIVSVSNQSACVWRWATMVRSGVDEPDLLHQRVRRDGIAAIGQRADPLKRRRNLSPSTRGPVFIHIFVGPGSAVSPSGYLTSTNWPNAASPCIVLRTGNRPRRRVRRFQRDHRRRWHGLFFRWRDQHGRPGDARLAVQVRQGGGGGRDLPALTPHLDIDAKARDGDRADQVKRQTGQQLVAARHDLNRPGNRAGRAGRRGNDRHATAPASGPARYRHDHHRVSERLSSKSPVSGGA